jgi:hypothetical protein
LLVFDQSVSSPSCDAGNQSSCFNAGSQKTILGVVINPQLKLDYQLDLWMQDSQISSYKETHEAL